jgi:hypothetical protein
MTRDFLPHKDAELLAWSVAFSEQITATPTAFGLTAPQATAYAALHTAFATALATVTNPLTRTRGGVSAKNVARTTLKTSARDLARIINAFPAITNQQRIDLGLNPRTGAITPINPPTEQPKLSVVGAVGRTLKVKLQGQDTSRRGKPAGVTGASVFSFVGSAAPAAMNDWTFEGSTGRTSFDVEFPPTVPAGAQVWLTAFWFNPRSQSGPPCTPIPAYLAGGVTSEAEAA